MSGAPGRIGSASWRGSWRVALRLARREIVRGKGRAALVAIMVGVPVLLVVSLATLYHTNEVSPRESLTSQLGQTAGLVRTTGDTRVPVDQAPDGDGWATRDAQPGPARPWTTAELQRLTGGRLLPLWEGSSRLAQGAAALSVNATELPLADPQTRGMVHLLSGRLPAKASEILLTPGLVDGAGWRVGSTVRDLDSGASFTVVGSYTTIGLSNRDRRVLGLVGALHGAGTDDPSDASYLVVRQQPISWAEVQQLNAAGLFVLSRAVVEHPPAGATLDRRESQLASVAPATKAVLALVVVSIVIEVVLLAGPAFAVGVRRRRRDLALLAATGSTPRDVRRTVLAHALLIGLGSASAGALLALPLSRAVMPVVEHYGVGLGPFDWRWRELAAALAVGAAAAVIAALAPALQAARADVATELAGRRGQVRSHPGWPVIGLVLLAGGATADLTRGTRPGGELYVAAGTVVIVLGAVALTPWLVGQVGRLARHLPLPLRLATRDAARQRSRSAPAVAAIMASVTGITALAIGLASDSAQGRRDYEPRTAPGLATVSLPRADAEPPVLAAIHEVMPGRAVFVGNRVEDLAPLAPGSGGRPGAAPTRNVVVAMPGCSLRQAAGLNEEASDCPSRWQRFNTSESVVADDIPTLRAFGVPLDAAAEQTLRNGGVLVAAPDAITAGHASVGVVSVSADGSQATVTVRRTLPAAVLLPPTPRTQRVASLVMTPETARSLGMPTLPSQVVIGGPTLSKGQQDQLNRKVTLLDSTLYVERGYELPYRFVLFLLLLVGSLVVLVATITATALAMSEARPDLATLAAVGAPPRTRRWFAAAQSVVIGLVGTALGVVLGFVPGLAVTWPLTANSYTSFTPPRDSSGPVIAIPWLPLLAVVVGVPLLAGLVTGVFTRSRLPMVRRLAR
ncbi:MAG: FtsX-like permease family protein [Actinomycetales bacterium]